jgi:hypothetical protein
MRTAAEVDVSKRRQRGGRLGGRKRSERKTASCRVNGRLGGLAGAGVRTESKAAAARLNGKLGGRPKNALAEEQALDAIFGAGD